MKTIAIVGRTNVGKSTLFNRLCQKKLAIVHDQPGVTRDRKEGTGHLYDLTFRLIDTAGLEETTSLAVAMWHQTEIAVEQADIILAIVDARTEITRLDEKMADNLRRQKKPVILIANKCEGKAQYHHLGDFYRLGLGDPIAISSEHGLGLGDLHQALSDYFKEKPVSKTNFTEEVFNTIEGKNILTVQNKTESGYPLPDSDADSDIKSEKINKHPLKLAIVGRPNVGKSTLINQLLGRERLLTGPEAGVTRDSITIPWNWRGHDILLTDTAGLRKRGKILDSLEKISAADTNTAIDFAEVVILVLDANTPMEKQDLLIASKVLDEGRSLIIALNKWDCIENQVRVLNNLKEKMVVSLQQVKGIPIHTISGKTGYGLDRMISDVFKMYALWNKRVPTSKLNTFLQTMTEAHPTPVASNGRRIPMKYMTQVSTRPPTFVIFSSNPDQLPESYLRYLSNGLREKYGLKGVPIRIYIRKRENPYAEKTLIRPTIKAKNKIFDRKKQKEQKTNTQSLHKKKK